MLTVVSDSADRDGSVAGAAGLGSSVIDETGPGGCAADAG